VVYCETRPSISSLCCFESSADYPCPVNLLCVWPCGILRIYIYNTFPESIFSSIFFLCLVNSWKLVKEKVKPLCQESVLLSLSLEKLSFLYKIYIMYFYSTKHFLVVDANPFPTLSNLFTRNRIIIIYVFFFSVICNQGRSQNFFSP
jgi:hypothetical protein